MITARSQFTNVNDLEMEVTIKATYKEWQSLLVEVNSDVWPGSSFHYIIRELLEQANKHFAVYSNEQPEKLKEENFKCEYCRVEFSYDPVIITLKGQAYYFQSGNCARNWLGSKPKDFTDSNEAQKY